MASFHIIKLHGEPRATTASAERVVPGGGGLAPKAPATLSMATAPTSLMAVIVAAAAPSAKARVWPCNAPGWMRALTDTSATAAALRPPSPACATQERTSCGVDGCGKPQSSQISAKWIARAAWCAGRVGDARVRVPGRGAADGEAAQHLCAVEHCLGDLDGLLLYIVGKSYGEPA